jgi:4a-hydroxytetrahydrobiopterin dehydratase
MNFFESQKFINEVSKIAEFESHHPDITFGWGYARIQIFTHKIQGLVENDFILAAKIDNIKF